MCTDRATLYRCGHRARQPPRQCIYAQVAKRAIETMSRDQITDDNRDTMQDLIRNCRADHQSNPDELLHETRACENCQGGGCYDSPGPRHSVRTRYAPEYEPSSATLHRVATPPPREDRERSSSWRNPFSRSNSQRESRPASPSRSHGRYSPGPPESPRCPPRQNAFDLGGSRGPSTARDTRENAFGSHGSREAWEASWPRINVRYPQYSGDSADGDMASPGLHRSNAIRSPRGPPSSSRYARTRVEEEFEPFDSYRSYRDGGDEEPLLSPGIDERIRARVRRELDRYGPRYGGY
jgi:hypothetical protein